MNALLHNLLKKAHSWLGEQIDLSFMKAFEAWYIDYHSKYPQVLTASQIESNLTDRLRFKVSGRYGHDDIHFEYEAYKAGRSRS